MDIVAAHDVPAPLLDAQIIVAKIECGTWLREIVAVAQNYKGVTGALMAAIEDPHSALHASCVAMRAAGTRLLIRAQAEGMARSDIDGIDLFALIGALSWLGDQPAVASRSDHLFGVVASAILTNRVGSVEW